MNKKTLIASSLLSVFAYSAINPTVANAQDGNNICVWNAMNTYNSGGGAEDLERAIKCADEAAVHEVTAPKAKTWFYRGQLYSLIFMDKTLKAKYATSGLEAVKAFKKLNEINDPKFKDWEDVAKYMLPLSNATFNEGVDKFQAKDYANAYQYFYAIKDINAVLEARGKKSGIDLATALKNAAISAENAGNNEASVSIYKDWIAVKPEAIAYRSYAQALTKAGKKEEALKVIDEALLKFPKDPNILVDKINVFLNDAKYTEALTYINNLLDVEPNNDGALFIKGLAYEKIGNEDSVVYYYTRSAEVNPKSVKPYNNLGALYVNKANALVEQMNKLGSSKADTEKYDILAKQRKELYKKAKPYLTKAKELDPEDASIARALKQVELYTAE
jgi:Flp pilus assembly protein TadD